MNQYCIKCGNMTKGNRYCSFCGADQQQIAKSVPTEYLPPQAAVGSAQPSLPKQTQKPVLGLVAIVTAAVVVIVCAASYFLFFADNEPSPQIVMKPSTMITESPNKVTASAEATQTIEPTALPAEEPKETVGNQTIIVSMAYDSGEGIYSGEVKDGAPHGLGSFEMLSSDNGKSWRYEGLWENGEVTGEGTMTQGTFVFTGSFKSGLLNGGCEITDNGVLRYRGMCQNGKLHGQGTLYTKSGMLLFQGAFDNDMMVESATSRQARGEAFIPECEDMDALLYAACLDGYDTMDYPTAVWGFSLAMGEQAANGTIVIGHMGDDSYPVCLVYRYGVDEPKMTGDDWINAWGVVAGTYEYVDGDGLTVTCPMIEVVCWNNEQEGL